MSGGVQMADNTGEGSQSLVLSMAKVVAGWDAKQAMMVLGTLSVLLAAYIFVGILNAGALPYTSGLQPSVRTYATASAFMLMGLALIVRSASQGIVERADKAQGMAVIHWTYPEQKLHLRSLRVPGHRDDDVWVDVCCGKSHLPQKVAVADDGWVGNFYLDLEHTEGLSEITFYRADEAASDRLDAYVSKANKNRKFRRMSEQTWPKHGLEEVFTLQVDSA